MMDIFTDSQDLIVQVGLIVAGLAVVWLVIRSLFRLTMRIFTMGCGLIFLAGLCFLIFQILR